VSRKVVLVYALIFTLTLSPVQFVHFESAPVEKLGGLKTAFFDVIKKVVENGIDMERMASVIHREYLKVYSPRKAPPPQVNCSCAGSFTIPSTTLVP